MGWEYDPTLAKPKDQVRFLVGDTNSGKQMFQDEEIDWALTTAANVYMCAADLCDQLVSKIGGGVKSKKISELAISYDPTFFSRLAGSLRARGYGHQVPFAGGVSVTVRDAQIADSDALQPTFGRNMEENTGAPKPNIPSGRDSNNPLEQV